MNQVISDQHIIDLFINRVKTGLPILILTRLNSTLTSPKSLLCLLSLSNITIPNLNLPLTLLYYILFTIIIFIGLFYFIYKKKKFRKYLSRQLWLNDIISLDWNSTSEKIKEEFPLGLWRGQQQ